MDKHLKMVREATWDVRAKWYDLGVELGINVGTLEVIYSCPQPVCPLGKQSHLLCYCIYEYRLSDTIIITLLVLVLLMYWSIGSAVPLNLAGQKSPRPSSQLPLDVETLALKAALYKIFLAENCF